jgi:hypothetical protein
VGGLLTISGRYFGTQKPKVVFISGGKKKIARVLGRSDTMLTVRVPKLTAGLNYQIRVSNQAGNSDDAVFFTLQ